MSIGPHRCGMLPARRSGGTDWLSPTALFGIPVAPAAGTSPVWRGVTITSGITPRLRGRVRHARGADRNEPVEAGTLPESVDERLDVTPDARPVVPRG